VGSIPSSISTKTEIYCLILQKKVIIHFNGTKQPFTGCSKSNDVRRRTTGLEKEPRGQG
jgi:hypothetical protein